MSQRKRPSGAKITRRPLVFGKVSYGSKISEKMCKLEHMPRYHNQKERETWASWNRSWTRKTFK